MRLRPDGRGSGQPQVREDKWFSGDSPVRVDVLPMQHSSRAGRQQEMEGSGQHQSGSERAFDAPNVDQTGPPQASELGFCGFVS